MKLRPVNNEAAPVLFFFSSSVDLLRQADLFFFFTIHRDVLGEAGESVFEARPAPEHSQDETLVISISQDVFRGRGEKKREKHST